MESTTAVPVDQIVRKMIVFKVSKTSDVNPGISFIKAEPNSRNTLGLTSSPFDAFKVEDKSAKQVVDYMEYLKENLDSAYQFTLVELTVTLDLQEVNMLEGDLLEERRRRAIAKLSNHDIEALGVERMATYAKLKFHNTENVS